MTDQQRAVLNCPMDPETNDAGAATIRAYLVELLTAVWTEQDGFDGKRPFGNSDWNWDLHLALVEGGLLAGTVDADGYLEEVDTDLADQLIRDAILAFAEEAP